MEPVFDWKDPRLRQASNPGPLDQQASVAHTVRPVLQNLLFSN